MIPRSGELYELNRSAVYHPVTITDDDDDATVPTLMLGGVRVSAYLDDGGVFQTSIATDEDELTPLLKRLPKDGVAVRVTLNDTDVYRWNDRSVRLTPELAADLAALIDYNWADEEHDYEMNGPEANDVFPRLQRLKAILPADEEAARQEDERLIRKYDGN